jgi:predicted P-loop ATPase
VILWPDADGKRHPLTPAERAAGIDPNAKPFLPLLQQPGMAAMNGIAKVLATEHGCTVAVCQLPQPGDVSDGWDCFDAIAQGWGAAELTEFINSAKPVNLPQTGQVQTYARDPAAHQGPDAWRSHLLLTEKGAIKPVRENLVIALSGVPSLTIAGIAEAQGVIAYNEFTNDATKLKPAPWGTPAGRWEEVDELLMGEWLARQHGLPSVQRSTLEEATRMVAYMNRFHPVREQLNRLRGTWDGTERLQTWIKHCCLAEVQADDAEDLHEYLARVGTWLVMAIVARVLQPGVKFDYLTVFEGPQGVGKSTLAKVLGGGYFADTGLDLGNKDSYQNLQGVSVYEFAELDALSKSEVTKVKQFISSASDRFRASFDRRARDYPRQVVFIGTTNEEHYLTDPTGNRRFWPVRVTKQIDLAWLRANRDQLFAEALCRYEAGHRFHPTLNEQRQLFEPQQQKRAVENAIESSIWRYLNDQDQHVAPGALNGALIDEISLVELLQKIGISIERLGPGRFHEKQAAAALRRLGWTEARSSKPGRPRVYRRPAEAPNPAPGRNTGPQHSAEENDVFTFCEVAP